MFYLLFEIISLIYLVVASPVLVDTVVLVLPGVSQLSPFGNQSRQSSWAKLELEQVGSLTTPSFFIFSNSHNDGT